MKTVILATLAVLLTSQAQALTQSEQDYLTIDTVTVQEIPDQSPLKNIPPTIVSQLSPLKEFEIQLDTVINIGQKIWTIIEAGKPVVDVELKSASAMPTGIESWQQLSGWQTPKSSTYRVVYTNLFGMNIVDFSYRVMFTYGGSFQGKGRYVTGATILPADLNVAWGFSFKAGVEIPTVINMGDEQNPIGGIQMNVNWVVSSVLTHSQTRASYFVDGRGQFQQMK